MLKTILRASAGTGKTFQIVKKGLGFEKDDLQALNLSKNLGLTPSQLAELDRLSFKNLNQAQRTALYSEVSARLKSTVFLSFSNAAAEEIKSRLYRYSQALKGAAAAGEGFAEGLNCAQSRVYTVHAFCLELARIFRYELGLSSATQFPADKFSSAWETCVDEFFRSRWDRETLKKELNYTGDPEKEKLLNLFYRFTDKQEFKIFLTKHGQKLFFLSELGIIKESDYAKTGLEESALGALEKELLEINQVEKLGEEIADGGAVAAQVGNLLAALTPELKNTRRVIEDLVSRIGAGWYVPYMYEESIFDFDALVFLAVKQMRKIGLPAFMARLDDEGFAFNHLFVDEAQDCDIIMNLFVAMFCGSAAGVETVIVGDAKQSIYRWRNAYPEEFLEMCKDGGAACKALQDSYRINNEGALTFINGFMAALKASYKNPAAPEGAPAEFFEYEAGVDALGAKGLPTEAVGKRMTVRYLPLHVRITKDNPTAPQPGEEALKSFVSGVGKTGVIFRSRANFRKSKVGEVLGTDLQYRLSEAFETESEYGDSKSEYELDQLIDIDPDYDLLKILFWGFAGHKKEEAAVALTLTPGGLALASGLWPDAFKAASAEGLIAACKAVFSELQASHYNSRRRTCAEALTQKLEEGKTNLWVNFARPACRLAPRQVARTLNHALASLYLFEAGRADFSYSAGEKLEEKLGASKIPYESSVPYENDNDGLSLKETITIHSSKGLTYDRVVLAANFTNLLNTKFNEQEGKDEYPHLLKVSFKEVLKENPGITVDYFPYLGSLPAKYLGHGAGAYSLPEIDGLFLDTLKRVKEEKANLLYVALTRTRAELLLIDIFNDGGGKKDKPREGEPEKLTLPLLLSRIPVVPLELPSEPYRPALAPDKPLVAGAELALPAVFKIKSVRGYIGETLGREPAASAAGAAAIPETLDHMTVGNRVHQVIEELLEKASSMDDYDTVVNQSVIPCLEDKEGPRVKQIMLSADTRAKLKPLIETDALKRSELPVWGVKDGCVLRGVLDGLLVFPEKLEIKEYKTLFGSSGEAQLKLGDKQVENYEALLKPLAGGRTITGEVIKIDAT